MAKPSKLEKILKSQQEKLETILKNPGKITWRDRLLVLRNNLKDPKCLTTVLGVIIGIYCLYDSYVKMPNYDSIPETLRSVPDYIASLQNHLNTVNDIGVKKVLFPEMLNAPIELIANTSDSSYSEIARQLKNTFLENRHLFQPDSNLESAINFLDIYKKKIEDSLGIGNKLSYSLEYLGGLVLTFISGIAFSKNYKNNEKYTVVDKKHYRKQLNKTLPEIRNNLQENPNAYSFYKCVQELTESPQLVEKHLEFLDLVETLSDFYLFGKKYVPLLQEITQKASSYTTISDVNRVIRSYEPPSVFW